MNKEEIDKWLNNEYGCSYTRLEELFDFEMDKQLKLLDKVEQLQQENQELKSVLDEIREYINNHIIATETEDVLLQILDKAKESE